MTLESAIAFVSALLVWVLIPGPAVLAIVGRSLTTGLKPALKLILGILLGDLFYLSIALFGLAAIGKALGEFFVAVRVLGGCYLVFLGIRLWMTEPAEISARPADSGPDRFRSLFTGLGITLGNPKAILFHLGFLPTFFDLAALTAWDALSIILIFMAVLGASLATYAMAASRARAFFTDRRKIRMVNRGAGALFIGAGVAVATRK